MLELTKEISFCRDNNTLLRMGKWAEEKRTFRSSLSTVYRVREFYITKAFFFVHLHATTLPYVMCLLHVVLHTTL